MDNRRHNEIDPWDEGVYGTGRTEPPKSNSGVVAMLMIIIIFLSGIISGLGFLNIRLFQQLQQAQLQAESIPMAFSQAETEEDHGEAAYYDEAAVSIPCLDMEGEYVSTFDQHYFSWPAGMLVTSVHDGGMADDLGLKPGDILTGINGAPITSQEELDTFLSAADPQGPFALTIHRSGTQLTLGSTD